MSICTIKNEPVSILNQARRPVAGVPGFLKLLLSGKSVCVCVSAPKAMIN